METKDYKSTLNMPNTPFSMKANLSEKEPQFFQFWKTNNIYKKALEKNKQNPTFILHDGPPYANGSLHAGHALNKILKDIVVRYKTLSGYYSPYVPGWDTHGLPIENKMLAENQKNHQQMSILELREKAAQYALSQIEIQKKQFLKFQLLSDFEHYYKTLDKEFETNQLKLFKKMCLDGLVYRGLKPVYWSPSSQSALAEAEVEYQDHKSPSIFVKFIVKQGNKIINSGSNLLIWTTTPWTLIANSGVAINKNFNYSLIECNQEQYVVATEMITKLVEEFAWSEYKILNTFSGSELIGLKYTSPINKQECPVVEGHHVTLEAGTGLVHIAPLFGEDDFIIGKKNNLNMIMHINDDGTINDKNSEYHGIFYEDVNKHIGQFLEQNKLLVKLKFIKHSYPHDWRTKKPIIFRGTPQWFVSIDKIKPKILNALKQVKFYSEWGLKRISTMIQNREDWTISRQRAWGVPIIIFYDEDKNPVINEEIFNYVIDLVSKHGSNIWYQNKVDDLLPPKYRGKNWTKENDIMDVWFDSGVSFMAANIDNNQPPFDLYLEGSDQYRGWFNSSLINGVAYFNQAPYKNLVSHGFLVDEKGRKMSKSLGNGIDPMDIINENGADILRLWVANSEYTNDISISKNIIAQNTEIYRKIRNTIRFLLSNLYDFNYDSNLQREGIHLLIKSRLENLKMKIKKAFDTYQFINVVKDINNFISELSSFYLSIVKDILYIEKPDNFNRRQVQTNLYEILDFLLISLNPILPTTTEEAYQFFNKINKKESIALEDFFKPILKENLDLENQWKEFFEIKDEVYRLIEEKIKEGIIKRSNEAWVELNISNEFIKKQDLKTLLMVGKVTFGSSTQVRKFNSQKCQRCWNHFESNDMSNTDLCKRCFEIIDDIKEN